METNLRVTNAPQYSFLVSISAGKLIFIFDEPTLHIIFVVQKASIIQGSLYF